MRQQSTAQNFAAKDCVSEDNWIGDCTLKKNKSKSQIFNTDENGKAKHE